MNKFTNKYLPMLFFIGVIITLIGFLTGKYFFLFLVFPFVFNWKRWFGQKGNEKDEQ